MFQSQACKERLPLDLVGLTVTDAVRGTLTDRARLETQYQSS
jgi:hypothetical protein